jgi:hypothetical protein
MVCIHIKTPTQVIFKKRFTEGFTHIPVVITRVHIRTVIQQQPDHLRGTQEDQRELEGTCCVADKVGVY